MKQFLQYLGTVLLICGLSFSVQAQNSFQPSDERSSFEERRKSILDANRLRATYHNYGFGGRTSEDNVDELFFEFPKNTNRRYLYFASVFTGAEVENQNTGEPMPVVVAPNYRTNPQTGESWAKNPVFGYYNEDSDELARSDQGPESQSQNTWPDVWPDKLGDPNDPGWPDQWNGYFGKDIFNADQEFYYRSGDDQYTRFSQDGRFRPDSNDPSRGGLGLIIDSRMLSWTQDLISSVHFNIFEIRNDSEIDYNKVAFMLWTADWLGTPTNDRPFFDQERSIAFYTDTSPSTAPPEFDDTALGVAGIRFLETPGNAVDGIDNNGDSDFYYPNPSEGDNYYDNINPDLYTPLTEQGGGFIADEATLGGNVVPSFTSQDFLERQLNPGDPIVLIDENDNRVILRYPPSEAGDVTVVTQGREVLLPAGGMTVREDTLNARHLNLLDDDLDGLIDENQPNHLELGQFIAGAIVNRPVRYINYTWQGYLDGHGDYPGFGQDSNFGWEQDGSGNWAPSDSMFIQRGLIIPDVWIEQRLADDEDFAEIINNKQENLRELYSRQPSTPIFEESFFDDYYRTHFTSAPMIDESREDFFDNNQNWEMQDDVGVDGVAESGSRGEGDGFPSSGAFTPFPGEPNIDKTDVRETDAIGITSATIANAGALGGGSSFLPDATIWNRYMRPGVFDLLSVTEAQGGDFDQFLNSSFFPLNSGSTERFAIAITAAQTNRSSNDPDIELVTDQLDNAFQAFDANYQFAIAPPPPALNVVPGDGRVTLYWDDEAENVFDRFLQRVGANPRNFEGYRVYRSTDPALADSRQITDGRGNIQFLKPIAQFDLDNGIAGNHPIDIFGLDFYLGNDSGLQRSYVDTDIVNGRTYYYVVTAYNSGAASAGIAPSESPVSLSLNPDGSLSAGQNVKRVVPTGLSAGYVGPAPLETERISGDATGSVFADIIDPKNLKPDTRYQVTFESETVTENGNTFDRTTSYSVTNLTENEVILEDRTDFTGQEVFFDGLKLTVINEFAESTAKQRSLKVHSWTNNKAEKPQATVRAKPLAEDFRDYDIVFSGTNGRSYTTQPLVLGDGDEEIEIESHTVAFDIRDKETGQRIPFAFKPSERVAKEGISISGGVASYYDYETKTTFADIIYILDDESEVLWELNIEPYEHNKVFELAAGTRIELKNTQEFTEDDVYEFFVDSNIHLPGQDLAAATLDNVRVVPNPYIVTNVAEPRPTGSNPRERQLHFTNLPAECTIRIFTISGRLVQTLNVNNSIDNDRYVWDMLTKDNLEMSYGVYIYHITAPGVGEKTGRFAVIK